MEKYIKPAIEFIEIETESSILCASAMLLSDDYYLDDDQEYD